MNGCGIRRGNGERDQQERPSSGPLAWLRRNTLLEKGGAGSELEVTGSRIVADVELLERETSVSKGADAPCNPAPSVRERLSQDSPQVEATSVGIRSRSRSMGFRLTDGQE